VRRRAGTICIKCFAIIFSILFGAFSFETARAETLGTIDFSGWAYGWKEMPVESLSFELRVLNVSDTITTIAEVSQDDIGQTLTLTNGSTEFSNLVSWLTNGSDDQLCLCALGPDGSGGCDLFFESSIQKLYDNGPDFASFEIEGISLTVNDLILEYPVSIPDMPEQGPNWNYIEYDVTLSFNGIPEPATIVLLGLGTAMLRRKKQHKTGRQLF